MIVIQQKRYHRTGKGMSGYDLQNMLPKLKKQYPWLAEVNSQSLQIVCHDLAGAYTRFFKKKAKYPAFKKKGHGGSFTCINNSRFEDKHIRIPKVGLIRFRGGDKPDGEIKRFTIKERAGKFYASILFDNGKDAPKPVVAKTLTGLDVGLNDLIVASNGNIFSAPKFLRKSRAKLHAAQKALSRCVKGSNGRRKARLKLAAIHMHVANQRKDFNHKITKVLTADTKNQGFAIEDLNVRGMMRNHCLAGSIGDAGWHQFRTFLTYKADAIGKQVIEVGRFFPSSKTCSACGLVREQLSLAVREWKCDGCGSVHQRDFNAAKNIAFEALRDRVGRGCVSRTALRDAAA
jgi:putative transposase